MVTGDFLRETERTTRMSHRIQSAPLSVVKYFFVGDSALRNKRNKMPFAFRSNIPLELHVESNYVKPMGIEVIAPTDNDQILQAISINIDFIYAISQTNDLETFKCFRLIGNCRNTGCSRYQYYQCYKE